MAFSPFSNWRAEGSRAPMRRGGLGGFGAFAGLLLAGSAGGALAQDNSAGQSIDYLERLKNCQQIVDNVARLECFDAAVSNIVTASETGEVRVVDREDVRQTRRSLFGFKLPDIGLFGDGEGEEEDELFSTTIERARYFSNKHIQFTTAEGAVWEMKNAPRRLRRIEPGDTVVFKPASFGYFFVRIDGQMGVKGRRIE